VHGSHVGSNKGLRLAGMHGSEAGSYLRLIDFVYYSTLGLRAIKKRRRLAGVHGETRRIQREFISSVVP